MDGQGGKLGRMLIESLRGKNFMGEILAIGTNSIATSVMLKAGADAGATGENPVIVSARTVDFIVGPLGIIVADALLGEVTPAMALAIAQSPAQKLLIPLNRCHNTVVGVKAGNMSEFIEEAVQRIMG